MGWGVGPEGGMPEWLNFRYGTYFLSILVVLYQMLRSWWTGVPFTSAASGTDAEDDDSNDDANSTYTM
jgi:hypothetical protein